jgi:hypothetical protein
MSNKKKDIGLAIIGCGTMWAGWVCVISMKTWAKN